MDLPLTFSRKLISFDLGTRQPNQAPNSAPTPAYYYRKTQEITTLIRQPQPSHPFNRPPSLHPPNPPQPLRSPQPSRYKPNPRHIPDKTPLHQRPRHPPTVRRPWKRSLLRGPQRRIFMQNRIQGRLGDPESDRARDMAHTFTGGRREGGEG